MLSSVVPGIDTTAPLGTVTESPSASPLTVTLPAAAVIDASVFVVEIAAPFTVTSFSVLVKVPVKSAIFLTLLLPSVSKVTELSPLIVKVSSTKVKTPASSVLTETFLATLTVALVLRPVTTS